jgi:signal transduction histidine kinase/DNA-binding response OmpR family regulator
MTSYSQSDYDFSSHNYDVIVGDDQKIYFANNSGILVFDGINWTQLRLPNETPVYTLAKSDDGTIYVGAINEFGYLISDKLGALKYVSLTDVIKDKELGTFTAKVYLVDDKIAASFNNLTVIIDPETKKMDILNNPGSNCHLLPLAGELFIFCENQFYQLKDNQWQFTKSSQLSEDILTGKWHLYKSQEGKRLIITQNGFFDFETEEKTKVSDEVEKFLKESTIYRVSEVSENYTALSTWSGLLIIDTEGNPIRFIDKKRGLPNNYLFNVALDQSGMLWAATYNGISKIDLFSSFSLFDKRMDVEGIIKDVQLHKGSLYYSVVAGVYKEDWNSLQNPFFIPSFESVSSSVCHQMINTGEDLFVYTERQNNQVLKNGRFVEIEGTEDKIFWAGFKYKDSDDLLLASHDGYLVHIVKSNDKWIFKKQFDPQFLGVYFLIEGEENDIWLSNIGEGVYRMQYDKQKFEILEDRKYDSADGLPDLNTHVYEIGSKPCFTTSKGIYRYDKATDSFIADERFIDLIGEVPVSMISEDESGNIYYFSDELVMLKKTIVGYEKIRFPNMDFKKYPPDDLTVIDSENVFISSSNIFIHINPSMALKKGEFEVGISSFIELNTDSIVFNGFGKMPIDLLFQPTENAFRVTYSATFYQNPERTLYKNKLHGFDETWSSWSSETKKDYTNLPHGDYTFEVVAKNVYGVESSTANFQFSIETPWFYSYWAFVIYAFGFITLIWAIVKMNMRRLINEKRKLEQVVIDRTEVISQQKEAAVKDAVTISSQRDKLLQMDEMKSRFFLNISHELRTPLTLTMGTVDQALKGKYGSLNDELYANLKVSYRNSQRLLKMVNNILDISKLEGGKMHLSVSQTKPTVVLAKVIDFFSSKFFGKNITIKSDLSSDVDLYIDHDKFETIFINLIANAFKFTDEGGSISLTVKEEIEVVHFSVNDDGIGIPVDDLPFIFDRFYQSGLTKNGEGTGVGLALTKELVELHKGNIAVRSDSEVGTTFTVTFLKGKDHLMANQILGQDDAQELKSLTDKYPLTDDVRTKEVSHQNGRSLDATKPHLLLVEDNDELGNFVEDLLKDDYHVSRAENGRQGLDFLKNGKPDLILTDYLMPVMDGFEMTTEIKKNDDWAFIPIIFLTARTEEQDKIEVLNLGVDDYLFKPFNEEELKVRINNLLNAKNQRAEFVLQKSIDPRDIEWKEFPSKLKLDIDNFIKTNIKEEITGEDLSTITGQSERSLYRKVKVNTGLSLMQYIKEYRLRTARALLESKEVQTVSEVSYAVGFNYLSHFTKNYKERFGKKPSEYIE